MCQMQMTAAEIAAVHLCSVDTLDRRLKEAGYANFAEFFQRYSHEGKMSLRRAQFNSAVKSGNVTMQIWLGKQMLGQKDKVEHDGPDGGPIRVIINK